MYRTWQDMLIHTAEECWVFENLLDVSISIAFTQNGHFHFFDFKSFMFGSTLTQSPWNQTLQRSQQIMKRPSSRCLQMHHNLCDRIIAINVMNIEQSYWRNNQSYCSSCLSVLLSLSSESTNVDSSSAMASSKSLWFALNLLSTWLFNRDGNGTPSGKAITNTRSTSGDSDCATPT